MTVWKILICVSIILLVYIYNGVAFIPNVSCKRAYCARGEVRTPLPLSIKSLNAMKLDEDEIGEVDNFKSSFVSILGNPNVGKSTLLNALLGEQLCITSPKPQTTRHRILGILTDDSKGYQIVFSDTPGMLKPAYALQETMATSIKGAVGDGDIIIIVTDVYGETLVDEGILSKIAASNNKVIVAVNKIDIVEDDGACTKIRYDPAEKKISKVDEVLNKKPKSIFSKLRRGRPNSPVSVPTSLVEPQHDEGGSSVLDTDQLDFIRATSVDENKAIRRRDERLLPQDVDSLVALWRQRLPHASCVMLSAERGWGVDTLMDALVEWSPPGPKFFPSDTLTTRDERFFASEIIRECLLNQYQDEVPYSCEVRIDRFREKSEKLSVIEATIVVSRESQKGIIIGTQGAALKDLGIKSRKRLEEFLDRGIYLDLRVKVDKNWRESKEALAAYGYVEDN